MKPPNKRRRHHESAGHNFNPRPRERGDTQKGQSNSATPEKVASGGREAGAVTTAPIYPYSIYEY